MKEMIRSLPEQIIAGKRLAEQISLPKIKDIKNIVVSGMGGSAIGGDLLFDILSKELSVTIYVNRSYSLPAFVNEDTLIFISSYSGNTEETLSSFRKAQEKTKNIICITSNGELAKESKFTTVKIPGGYQPRAAIGYLFTPMLVILSRIGIIKDKNKDIEECVKLLKSLTPDFDSDKGEPYALAEKLNGKVPIIYADFSFQSVTKRWSAQLNENSKTFAHYNIFPELNHNEIVGFGFPTFENFCIFLRDKEEHQQVKKRIDITKEIIGHSTSGIEDIWSKGESFLTRVFSLIYFGDWVSYWLAVIRKVDPTPVERISYLKKRLE